MSQGSKKKKDYVPVEIEPLELAVNDTNCELGEPFRDKITIKGEKLFKKNKTNKYFKWVLKKNRNIENFINILKHNRDIPPIPSTVVKYLNNKIDSQIPDNKYFLIPFFAEECYKKEGRAFWVSYTPEDSLIKDEFYQCERRIRDKVPNVITFPPPLYICKNQFYTEYAISLIFSDFYTHDQSIHFVPVERGSFSTCLTFLDTLKRRTAVENPKNTPNISITEFFSMDRVKGHSLDKCPGPYQNACLIQVLHSIAVYQKPSISHNDLHGGNIMVEQILYSTRWNNQELINYDCFQYNIGDNESLYIPFVPFLIKIIDFGLSCKYSPEVILNENIMTNKVGEPPANPKSLIPPNWYFPAYDVLMFLFNFCIVLFPENLLGQHILWVALHFPEIPENRAWTFTKTMVEEFNAKQFYSKYNEKWVKCIIDVNPNLEKFIQVTLETNIIERYKNLTSFSLLQKCMNNSSILKSYTQKPPDAKCIILGTTDFPNHLPINYQWAYQKRDK